MIYTMKIIANITNATVAPKGVLSSLNPSFIDLSILVTVIRILRKNSNARKAKII